MHQRFSKVGYSARLLNGPIQARRHLSLNTPGRVKSGWEQVVGQIATPLVHLPSISQVAGCKVYGKCEFLNPCGSHKDRMALGVILGAEQSGILQRGRNDLIIESTTGNTGISLSVIARVLGYKPIIIVPKFIGKLKKDRLRFYGGNLIEVPAVPNTHPNHLYSFGMRLYTHIKEENERLNKKKGSKNNNNAIPNNNNNNNNNIDVLFFNQHDNLDNFRIHELTTGKEIYEQTDGQIKLFSMCMGTAGTLSGVSKYLLDQSNGKVKICLTDPIGSFTVNYFNKNELVKTREPIILKPEGTPNSRPRVNKTINNNEYVLRPDYSCEILEEEALNALKLLHEKEGLMAGLSSGTNIAGIIKSCKKFGLKSDDVAVTVLCDTVDNYIPNIHEYYANYMKYDPINNKISPTVTPTAINEKTGRMDDEIVHPFEKGSDLARMVEEVFEQGLKTN